MKREAGSSWEAYAEACADTSDERADFARYRAGIYRMASSVFVTEPTETFLSQLFEAAQLSLDAGHPRACEGVLFQQLRNYAEHSVSEMRECIAGEYAELFIGPRPPLAPLYESLYQGFPNRLFADVTRQVGRFYERCGLAVSRRNRVPDDHIGYELEFMATLCEREVSAVESGSKSETEALQKLQLEFIVMHLGAWVSPFARRIEAAECAGYFELWAQFVEAFVYEDDHFLSGSLKEASCVSKLVS